MKELIHIQTKLNAPKKRENKHGHYMYRSLEDILEAVKPLLDEMQCQITFADQPVVIEGWHYIMSIAKLKSVDGREETASGYAREPETSRTGNDLPQITGSATSYARKYALSALFAIDDSQDPDAQEPEPEPQPEPESEEFLNIQNSIMCCNNMETLQALWNSHLEWAKDKKIVAVVNRRKGELSK